MHTTIFRHSINMSGVKNTKIEKKLKNWFKITTELLQSADENQLDRISNRLSLLLKRVCSHSDCDDRETKLYYCKNCKSTHPVCKTHFKYVNRRLCLVCDEYAITRRWSTPYQKL